MHDRAARAGQHRASRPRSSPRSSSPATTASSRAVRLRNAETDETEELEVGGAFVAIGHIPRSELVEGQVDIDDNGYVVTDDRLDPDQPRRRLRGRRPRRPHLPPGGHRRRHRLHGRARRRVVPARHPALARGPLADGRRAGRGRARADELAGALTAGARALRGRAQAAALARALVAASTARRSPNGSPSPESARPWQQLRLLASRQRCRAGPSLRLEPQRAHECWRNVERAQGRVPGGLERRQLRLFGDCLWSRLLVRPNVTSGGRPSFGRSGARRPSAGSTSSA